MSASSNQLPSYFDFSIAYNETESAASISEIHGMVAGVGVLGERLNGINWFDAVGGAVSDESNTLSEMQHDLILSLYQINASQLQGSGFDFQLLLPDDEEPLAHRAMELTNWCYGFLFGLGLGGESVMDALSEEAEEALHHISEIGQMDHESIESTEDDEQAFFDVCEYVRMGAIMIFTELCPEREVTRVENDDSTIH